MVDAFNMTENSSCGPQMKMLRVDWDHPGMSRWTKRLAVLFEADFICEHGIGSFPSLVALPQAGHIAHVFFRYIKHLKAVRAKMVLDSHIKTALVTRDGNVDFANDKDVSR